MKRIFAIFIILCCIHFWKIIYLPTEIFDFADVIALLIASISFFQCWGKNYLLFRNAIILLFIGYILNIASAYINQGQSPIETFKTFGSLGYYYIIFYFVLHNIEISRKELEQIIIIFAVLFSLIYVIQVLNYPQRIVRAVGSVARGTIRFRIEGNGFLVLAYFLLLNRYLLYHRIINLLLALGFFIILIMGGFRTLTFGAFLLTGLMVIKLARFSPWNYAVIFLLVLFFVGLFKTGGSSKILNEMINNTINQKEQGENYIRIRQIEYFYSSYPKNISYFIVGGGMPGTRSAYAQSTKTIEMNYKFLWVDIGLFGFYIVIGCVTILGLLWYTLRAIFIKLPRDRLYLNYYFAYLLIASFTTMEIFRPGIFAVEAIGLYLIDDAVLNKDS